MAKAAPKPHESAPEAAPESAARSSYVCTRHVNCDHIDYYDGDPIELDANTAAALLECGAIVAAGA